MRILVTGAAGFIGSHLAEALAAEGHEVTGLDDWSGGKNVPCNVEMVTCDIAAERPKPGQYALSSVVPRARPEVLVHCAANAREGESMFSPEKITRANLWAYARTLRACIAAGSLQRVVFFSSMAVYGKGDPPFDEGHDPRPVDVYGWNKLAAEGVTFALASVHGYAPTVVRPHNVFGPRQSMRDRFRNVVAIWCNRVLRGEPIHIYGDGEQRRAFSTIEDSLGCYVRAVHGAADGLVVNVGGTVPITLNALADAVCADMGVPTYERVHLPDRPAEVKHAFSSWRRSMDVLGFDERVGWREGVRRMCEWARAQGPQPWNDNEHVELAEGRGLPATWAAPTEDRA